MQQHKQQQKPLELARTRYLEQQCLMQQLEDLMHEVQHVLLDESATTSLDALGDDADAKLQQAGLQCPAEAAASLIKHLQASYTVQRLELPSAGQPPPHSTAEAGRSDVDDDSDQLGSRQHLLGVTPEQLRKLHMPSRKAAQTAHAPVLPLLEQRLEQQVQAAVAAIAGPSAGPEAAAHVTSMIEAKQAQLVGLQQSSSELLQQYTQQAQGYLQELTSIQQVLQQLLSECMLVEQPALDKKHREYLGVTLKQLGSKLESLHINLREVTYAAKNMPALTAIGEELQQAERDTAAAVEQVSAQLLAYAQLGDDFSDIVKEYAGVKAQSQELDNVINHLQKVEDEAEYF